MYVAIARQLPMPTSEQARAFAHFVTGAHSWYKHLRPWGAHPFVFYLDPNAGRRLVRQDESHAAFLDIAEGERSFHYSTRPTAEYRRRFGHWNYAQPYSPGFQFATAQGIEDTAGTGLTVLSARGEWLTVPADLAAAGTAGVNALMYWPDSRGAENLSTSDQERRVASLLRIATPHPLGVKHYLVWVNQLEETLPRYSGAFAQAVRSLVALWKSPLYAEDLNRIGQPLVEAYDRAQTREERDRLFEDAHARWQASRSRQAERKLYQPAAAALDVERARQLGAMVAAMDRFLAALRRA